MIELRWTVVADGTSDRVLIPILDWLLQEQGIAEAESMWADFSKMSIPPKSLKARVEEALKQYPCDLLFIHRDAEREPYNLRKREIIQVVESLEAKPLAVCVVPVRMQEAWLLLSERAIRFAASNPNGRKSLDIPPIKDLEAKPDPKHILYDLILAASELKGRRLKTFRQSQLRQAPHLIAQYIYEHEGFAALRSLSAFAALEADIQAIIAEQSWNIE